MQVVHNRWGLHWANVHIGEQLGRWAIGMSGDCYLVIDGSYGWIPKIREVRPNAVIVHRHAVPNWMDMEPTDWAEQMGTLFHQHEQYTKHVELECEPDIFPNFPGWGQPIVDRLKFAAEWNIEVAKRLRELCPGVIIHSPPLAHERIDLPQWFEIWKPVMDASDVLDMHCYWEKNGQYFAPGLYDEEESYHRAFRYRKIRDFLETRGYWKPMMVTECGNFAPDRPDYAEELIYYFSELEKDAAYMIGGCVFILKSNQFNWVNDLTRQPNIESFFKKIADAPKKTLPFPGPGGDMEIPQWLTDVRDTLEKHPTKQYKQRSLDVIDTIVVHHTATKYATPGAIARWHVRNNKWPGASYHIYIRKDGSAYLMNDLEAVSYHCYKHNRHTLALAFEGDFTKESHTAEQIQVGQLAVEWFTKEVGKPLIVKGHKTMPDNSTACPGAFPVGELIGEDPEPDEGARWKKKYENLHNGAVAAIKTLQAVLDV